MIRQPVSADSGIDRSRRRGVALLELALMMPLLCFILVASADFARAFHDYVAVTECARNGALYASQNPALNSSARQAGIANTANADANNLPMKPSVTSSTGSDRNGNPYTDVTVSSQFQTLTPFPGIPNQLTLTRTVRMRAQPTTYRMH
jgi:Flp pilus assembly protein TadG